MAYIDETYYITTFGGGSIVGFGHLAEIASDIIDGIVAIPVSTLDTESAEYAKVKRACAYIVESLDANGGVDAITGMSSAMAESEHLGDYTISNSQSNSAGSGLWYGDIKIPMLAYMLLQQIGLLGRWAYKGTVIDDGH